MAEARFTLPDGRTGTLRGASMQEITRKAEEMGATLVGSQEAAGTTPLALNNAVGGRALNALSNITEDTLNVPARVLNGLSRFMFTPVGSPTPDRPAIGPNFEPPQVPLMTLPSGQELAAAIESPMQAVMAGQSLVDAYQARLGDRRQIAQDRPLATVGGEVLTDVAALTMARRPMRAGQAGGAFDQYIARGMQGLSRMVNPQNLSQGARAFASDIASSGAAGALARGLGRVGEAGIEGAALGVLQGGDPAELAAAGAGLQAVGSIANQARDLTVGAPGKLSLRNVAATIGLGTVALGLLYSATPFDEETSLDPLEWLSTNFDKVVTGAGLGIAFGLAGRRGSTNPGTMGGYFPDLADALSAVPRTALLELVRESQNDEAIRKAMQNASALGESDAKKFVSIVNSDEPANGLRNWMEGNPRVRRLLGAPDVRLAGVPVTEE